MVIRETLETKVTEYCDVLVCGGGFAGISAALASARQGKKTVLFEKQYMLGGLGTAGIVTIYLPLWVLTKCCLSGYNKWVYIQKL